MRLSQGAGVKYDERMVSSICQNGHQWLSALALLVINVRTRNTPSSSTRFVIIYSSFTDPHELPRVQAVDSTCDLGRVLAARDELARVQGDCIAAPQSRTPCSRTILVGRIHFITTAEYGAILVIDEQPILDLIQLSCHSQACQTPRLEFACAAILHGVTNSANRICSAQAVKRVEVTQLHQGSRAAQVVRVAAN